VIDRLIVNRDGGMVCRSWLACMLAIGERRALVAAA
jgi:hypothetical protein